MSFGVTLAVKERSMSCLTINQSLVLKYVIWGDAGCERAQHILPYDKPEPCAKVCCLSRVRTVFESLGKMGYTFPGHESLGRLGGVCESL